MIIRLAPLLMLPVLLAGCAAGPTAVAIGPGPTTGGSYRFAAETAEAVPLEPLVEAQLRTLGLEPGDTGRYLVELGFGERPIHVGAFDRETAPATRDDPTWRRTPARRSWWKDPDLRACVLSVRISEAKSGEEIYRVDAQARRKKARCGELAPRLVETALSEVPLPPTTR